MNEVAAMGEGKVDKAPAMDNGEVSEAAALDRNNGYETSTTDPDKSKGGCFPCCRRTCSCLHCRRRDCSLGCCGGWTLLVLLLVSLLMVIVVWIGSEAEWKHVQVRLPGPSGRVHTNCDRHTSAWLQYIRVPIARLAYAARTACVACTASAGSRWQRAVTKSCAWCM